MLRPNDSLGLLTLDIPTCICADAFLLARASLQIRLQPRAVVASRLYWSSRGAKRKEKKKKGTEEWRNERKHHEDGKKEEGSVPRLNREDLSKGVKARVRPYK